MMANRHRPFEGNCGQIFRWLLDNGPAQAAAIAKALNMQPHHVTTILQRRKDDLYVRLGKVRLDGGHTGTLWSVWED